MWWFHTRNDGNFVDRFRNQKSTGNDRKILGITIKSRNKGAYHEKHNEYFTIHRFKLQGKTEGKKTNENLIEWISAAGQQ